VTRPTPLPRTGPSAAGATGAPHGGETAAGATLQPFASAHDRTWVWKRPRLWHRRYELRAGDALLGVLESRTALRSAVAGETAGERWRLRHEGLLRGRVRVVHEGHAGDEALYRPRWFGAGEVTTRRGRVLRWHRADFWGRRWEMVDTGGLPWVVFTRTPTLLSLDTRVDVAEHARKDLELQPVVLLGFYLIVLMARQVHAAH
jgi:hypothetical protein